VLLDYAFVTLVGQAEGVLPQVPFSEMLKTM
jgi:hypothetical protein